ncbi:ATP-binding protein [Actinoplanes sp. NPDC051494]|uniref:ATP-binding protein n=1 Tax=Actinoplanes sp. NPDC051494 TaxID=3363907 RepID=UPI0037AFB0FB
MPESTGASPPFEAAPGLYLVLDPDFRIVTATDAYLQVAMVQREQVVGRDVFAAFPDNPDDPAATGTKDLRASLLRVLERREPDTMSAMRYDIDDGHGYVTRYWRSVNTPVLDPDGRVRFIIQQVEDVTDLLGMQEANEALRNADDAKNEYLSRMSHELRTPLNAVLGFSELLTLSDIDEAHRGWAGLIHNAGKHLLALLDDILDTARIEGGHLTLSVEPVAVGPLIAEVLALVSPLADTAGVRLAPAPELPTDHCVSADRQRLRQVMMNLLSNAIKFNHPTGTVTVTVQEQGERTRIDVVDTGRGIPAESLGALFTPFERLDAGAAGFEGTGLGLSLSRHLTQSMGGRLEVSSELGKGSTFWLDLPTTDSPDAGTVPDELPALPSGTRPATVLYVEDVMENIRLVEDMLAHRPSVTLIPAALGAAGLDLAREHVPDLILLDLHLPDMPGEDLFEQLKADPATHDIPVVALSADATTHHIERLHSAGVAAYLTKPVTIRELLATLDRLLPTGTPARHAHDLREASTPPA